jgi:hypothetical protein
MFVNPNVYYNVPFLNVPSIVLLSHDTLSTTCKIFFYICYFSIFVILFFSCYCAVTQFDPTKTKGVS